MLFVCHFVCFGFLPVCLLWFVFGVCGLITYCWVFVILIEVACFYCCWVSFTLVLLFVLVCFVAVVACYLLRGALCVWFF